MEGKNNISPAWLIGILVVLIVVLTFLFSGIHRVSSRPTGTIFITSSTDPSQSFLQTYTVNLSDGSTASVGYDASSIGTMYSFSDDGSQAAFIGVSSDRVNQALAKKASVGQVMQIYRTQTSQQDIGVPLVGSSEQVTASDDAGKMMPVVSDDGQVLYVTTSATGSNQPFTSYQLHLASNTSPAHDMLLGAGTQPQWLSNNTYYFIGSDGIRMGGVAATSSFLVLPVAAQSNFKISVSPDHHTLAFSNPDAHKVFLFTISHEGLILTPLKELDIVGYWTIFSPDGHFIAIQTAQDAGTGSPVHPSLSFFDMNSFSHIGDVPLDPLLNDRLFITAWR